MDFTVRARHDELGNVINLLKLMLEHTDGCGHASVTVEYGGMPSADTVRGTEVVVPKDDVKDEVVAAEPVEKEQEMPGKPKDEQKTKNTAKPDIEYTKEDVISALQNLASKRLAIIYEYIYTKYPYFLANNAYIENEHYQNFLLSSQENRRMLQEKIKTGSKKELKYE